MRRSTAWMLKGRFATRSILNDLRSSAEAATGSLGLRYPPRQSFLLVRDQRPRVSRSGTALLLDRALRDALPHLAVVPRPLTQGSQREGSAARRASGSQCRWLR